MVPLFAFRHYLRNCRWLYDSKVKDFLCDLKTGCSIQLLRKAVMEYADYHVVYVDNRVSSALDGKLIQSSSSYSSQRASNQTEDTWDQSKSECLKSILGEIEEVRSNLRSLLSVFHGGKSESVFCIRGSERWQGSIYRLKDARPLRGLVKANWT